MNLNHRSIIPPPVPTPRPSNIHIPPPAHIPHNRISAHIPASVPQPLPSNTFPPLPSNTQQAPISSPQIMIDGACTSAMVIALLAREQLKVSVEALRQDLDTLNLDRTSAMKVEVLLLDQRGNQVNTQLARTYQQKVGEVWASYWVATPIAHLLPRERCEEWLGDLYEGNRQLLQTHPRWLVNAVNFGKVMILVWSAIKVGLEDFLQAGRRKGN